MDEAGVSNLLELFKQFREELREHPLYAIVLLVTLALAFGRLSLAGPWAGLTALGILGLAAFAMIQVGRAGGADRRYRSLLAQRRHARELLEGMADEGAKVFIVYSTLRLASDCAVIGEDGEAVDLRPTPQERRFVTFVDAQGIGRISELLHLAGARPQIEHVHTSRFSERPWGDHEVLVGGPASNGRTELALEQFAARVGFTFDRHTAIVGRNGQGIWRTDDQYDYGLIAKIKIGSAVLLIAAGLTSHSTLGCCTYLVENIANRGEFSAGDEFACIVSVSPPAGLPHTVEPVWPPDLAAG